MLTLLRNLATTQASNEASICPDLFSLARLTESHPIQTLYIIDL